MADNFYELDQFVGLQLDQDWSDDFADPYAAAEEGISRRSDEQLRQIHGEITRFLNGVAAIEERLIYFDLNGAFPGRGNAFDVWLQAVRRRIEQALAGIHSEPLEAPPGYYGNSR